MMNRVCFSLMLLGVSTIVNASIESTNTQDCVMTFFAEGDATMTLEEIRAKCHAATENKPQPAKNKEVGIAVSGPKTQQAVKPGLISERIKKEAQTQFEPYVITPHRINYILPAYTTNAIHKEPYQGIEGYQENLAEIETKYQLSFKVPVLKDDLFIEGDALYFGFTVQAWWQVYADNISKPFRETNYQPEMFYMAPLNWHPFGGNTGFMLGAEHQSNGRNQALSRSWNRVYGQFLFEKDNFALSFRPWARISEKAKESPLDPKGDDNPDITDYMGHFELGMLYEWQDMELMVMGRNNFSTHNGAIELGLTFPLWGKLQGYAVGFHGYGESLIDYNHKQTRFGIGIALNDLL
ncbi:phospholipase A [Planctobacterium marinum]|uniref:Phospholipase A1 n=1 Tax=Planctobacterium marinum TaxID=1631968 RepID=A0AA48KVU4_9ALTE|nr:phospholipase [Planctobacterium marinum]